MPYAHIIELNSVHLLHHLNRRKYYWGIRADELRTNCNLYTILEYQGRAVITRTQRGKGSSDHFHLRRVIPPPPSQVLAVDKKGNGELVSKDQSRGGDSGSFSIIFRQRSTALPNFSGTTKVKQIGSVK